MKSNNIANYIFELTLLFVVALVVAPPIVPVTFNHAPVVGFIHGLSVPFTYIISIFIKTKTAYPSYVTDNLYWLGYSVGVGSLIGGSYYQLLRIYQWRRKNQPPA